MAISQAVSTLRSACWPLLAGRYTDPKRLQKHIAMICKERGVADYFERFERASTISDGLRLHLDVIEVSPTATTIVFMPGTNAYTLLYGDYLTALAARGFNVVAFDPRGHGRSAGRRGSYVIDELIRDMDAAVAYARARFKGSIAVSGSSQGGITAFYYAAAHDDIVCAICHNIADLADPESVRLIRHPNLGAKGKPLLLQMARWLPECPVPMTAYLDLAKEPVRSFGNARKVLYWDPLLVPYVRLKTLASLGTTPLARPIEEIQTPVFILQAGEDTIFPTDYITKLHDRLSCPKSLQVYPGLPHYLIIDFVDEFIDDVVAWLEECGAESAASQAAPSQDPEVRSVGA